MTFEENELGIDELRAMPLGERIYRIRKSLDLSQAEVAGAVGVNIKTVNRWENDQADPQRQSRAALAQATGYPESLFKRKTPAPPPVPAEASSAMAEISTQLQGQTRLLETLTAVGTDIRGVTSELRGATTELRGAIGELHELLADLRKALDAAPQPSPKRRPA